MVSAPSAIGIPASSSRTVEFSDYVSDGSYTVSCGTPTASSSLVTVGTPTGCSVEITSGTNMGIVVVSVPFTSDGGASTVGSFTFDIGAASNIVFSAPTGLKVGTNRTRVIDVLDYASDGNYIVTCGTATAIDTTELSTVVRDSSGNGCSFTITPKAVQGAASFTVPLTSDGGDTHDAVFSITVGPASTISYTGPTGLLTARNRLLVIDASSYVSEAGSGYVITCADATSVHSRLTSVTRSGCSYTITPSISATAGNATFGVTFTSDGGHSRSETITVEIGPNSTLTYNPPVGLRIGRNYTLVIDALDYVTGNSAYTVTCGDATGCLLYTSPSPRD